MTITPWRDVPSWCLGANDKFGICFFAMFGNRLAQTTGQIMSDAEVESAARVIEHLNVLDRSTDRGEAMEAGLNYIQANGWPPDPLLTIRSWRRITRAEIAASLAAGRMVGAAISLPMNAAGDDYDFTDDAIARNAAGAFGHAVYVVGSGPEMFITWARPQGVTDAWWDKYCLAVYEIDFGPAVAAIVA
jgi:hypothetical protein